MSAICSHVKNDGGDTATSIASRSLARTQGTISRIAVHEGDRQLRRTSIRFGEEFRQIRLRSGVSQAEVARAIGVARSVICRLEQGAVDVSPRIRARAAAVLGAELRIVIYAEAAPLIHDAAHARIVESFLETAHPSWRITVESPVPGPGRRSSDIRLDRGGDTILVEVETHIRALEAIIRECADKRAAVASTLAPAAHVHTMLVLPPTRHHRDLVATHPQIIARVFPARPTDIHQAVTAASVPWPGDGILWLAPGKGRRRALVRVCLDIDRH